MRARVYVTIKPTILDPQGQTICAALQGMGHREITAVRQGKFFELELDPDCSPQSAVQSLEEVGRDVLANAVTEDYRIELVEDQASA